MSSKVLKEVASRITERFEKEDNARDEALALHRKVIKSSSLAIRAVHRGEMSDADRHLQKAERLLRQAHDALQDFPNIHFSGFLQDAEKEFAEAKITQAVIAGRNFPEPEELGIDYPPYLNGLGEAVGELRRYILDRIRLGKLEESERILEVMDEIYYILIAMDFPDAITKGLRRTTDIARGCLERTRGDLTNHFGRARILEGIEFIKSQLPESYASALSD